MGRTKGIVSVIVVLLAATLWSQTPAGGLRGIVTGGGVAVPGANVTASLGQTVEHTVTDSNGRYSLRKLARGKWTVNVAMPGFRTAIQVVRVAGVSAVLDVTLTIAPAPAAASAATQGDKTAAHSASAASSASETAENVAADPVIAVNGSMQNAAASQEALPAAFGNYRPGGGGLYTGGVGLNFNSSALDAQPFSLTGHRLNPPSYDNITGSLDFGGPLIIPHLFNFGNAPTVTIHFERQSDRTVKTVGALVPTAAERSGDLSGIGTPVIDPATGKPFTGNQVPVSAVARALLELYPLPNQPAGTTGYNYQSALAGQQRQTRLQLRVNKYAGKNQFWGTLSEANGHVADDSLFGFHDTLAMLALKGKFSWQHRFSPYLFLAWTVNYSRQRAQVTPNFAGKTNISAAAGIQGNDQTPANWGPPTLQFATGIATLRDGEAQRNRDQTLGLSGAGIWNPAVDHNLHFGVDVHWLQFNDLQQANGRGAFQFTGAATGNAWADFLLGTPDGVTLANGNADKYLRERTYDAFVSDDWRVNAGLTANLGVRWEYEAPATEMYNRLANIDVTPDFGSAATVTANAPVGPLTGARHPHSLLQPFRGAIEPRLAVSWQPLADRSLLLQGGYGWYQNTSVYPALALRLAQQAPFATSLNLQNSAATPLTMGTAFLTPAGVTPDVFGVAPNFRPGMVQSWSASAQEDLPANLVLTLSYLGTRGTHQEQEILPNTIPPGGENPCPACPVGFVYLTAQGESVENSGTLQLQRHFSGGLAALGRVTWAHAMDDAGLGGRGQSVAVVAQNWLNPAAEWGRSSFDQRLTTSMTVQYSTGASRLALLRDWEGTALRGWTLTGQLTAGSGLPLTPTTSLLVPDTANAVLRPSLTGVPVTRPVPGRHLDPAAYQLPAPGEWGNAGRNSISGPAQFNVDAGMQRRFQMTPRITAILRVEATNVLNHVSFPSWNTLVGGAQFGLPQSTNSMRKVKTTLRFTF